MLAQQLGSDQRLSKLGGRLGADAGATKTAVGAALPVLLGALARNSAQPQGADGLDRALGKHDGSVLDDLDGFLDRPDVDDGDGILGHVLGPKRNAVEAGVGRASGLDPSMVLAGLLGTEQQRMERSNPAMGMLGSLLDQDDDGNVMDDIANMGKGLLGGLFGGR
jgi:hypothetical protein